MAKKCSVCEIRAAKRYCAAIDNVLCPVCCAKNRMKTIDCQEDCKYLDGVEYQKKRAEEKYFSQMMESAPHGKYDDIFKIHEVAQIAAEIESFVNDIYVSQAISISDKMTFEAYKKIYQIHSGEHPADKSKLTPLAQLLLDLYMERIDTWRSLLPDKRIGEIFLRLMLSIKNMTGGSLGEFSYLNYLKNNLFADSSPNELIIEDKFGNKIKKKI